MGSANRQMEQAHGFGMSTNPTSSSCNVALVENGGSYSSSNNGSNNTATTTPCDLDFLLNALDHEILHAEEQQLMHQHHVKLQRKLRWETRGQRIPSVHHATTTIHPMTNAVAVPNGQQNQQGTANDTQRRPTVPQSQRNDKKRPRLQLQDGEYDNDETMILDYTELTKPNVLRLPTPKLIQQQAQTQAKPQIQLQQSEQKSLIRTTILLPRMYMREIDPTKQNSSSSSTTTTTGTTATTTIKERIEWKKQELEHYLVSKFKKFHRSKYKHKKNVTHQPANKDNIKTKKDTIDETDWTTFSIQLQSANINSWRCTVMGYRDMVQDVLSFLQHQLQLHPVQQPQQPQPQPQPAQQETK
jgi:hypothetical protein